MTEYIIKTLVFLLFFGLKKIVDNFLMFFFFNFVC